MAPPPFSRQSRADSAGCSVRRRQYPAYCGINKSDEGLRSPGFEIQGKGLLDPSTLSADIHREFSDPDRLPDRHFGHGPSIAAQMS
jgi:hypothetical protein